MCGRFTFRHDLADISEWLDDCEDDEVLPARYNIAPTDPIQIVRMDADGLRRLHLARWGYLIENAKPGPPLINARGETVATKYPFKFSFAGRRCLVPMSGYYEWRAVADGKQPYFVHPADDGPLAAAAVHHRAPDPKTGALVETVAIITIAARPELTALHERMPVFVPPAQHARWLDPATPVDVAQQLVLALPGLEFAAVSRRVNSVKNDGPDLLDPLAL